MTTETAGALAFPTPGPGTWLLDAVHMPRPFTRFQAAVHPPNLAVGCRESFRRYGLLVDTLDYRMINGLGFFAPVPAPDHDVPARFANAADAVARKLWREDLARWTNEVKPASVRDNLALQSVDPATLDDAELAAHIERCTAHLGRMVQQHHSLNSAAILPLGDFMAALSQWTDAPLGQFLALLRGSAPESAGTCAELEAAAQAIRASDGASRILASPSTARETLAALSAAPAPVGAAVQAYLDIVSWRLLDSLDTGDRAVIEAPEVIVEGLRAAVEGRKPQRVTEEEEARLRALIPAEHRPAFDELLGEARAMSRLRDERGLYSDVWAAGIARRALLEAGRRLVAKDRLYEPAHLIEADPDEIRLILSGQGGPGADELAARADDRLALRASDAPPFLGDPPHPPPPLDGLPPPVQRLMRALGIAIDALFAPSAAQSDVDVVRGTPASPGRYTGTARLVGSPDDFGRLQHGDVLVTSTTTEAFNLVLPMLGAIVTDNGGLLSHAAIVSREYGIPGVVGCLDATARISDGARVTVDGSTGEIRLEPS
ncbi:MAG: PEP-utilizing enzyme [Alsobacter sp.]